MARLPNTSGLRVDTTPEIAAFPRYAAGLPKTGKPGRQRSKYTALPPLIFLEREALSAIPHILVCQNGESNGASGVPLSFPGRLPAAT